MRAPPGECCAGSPTHSGSLQELKRRTGGARKERGGAGSASTQQGALRERHLVGRLAPRPRRLGTPKHSELVKDCPGGHCPSSEYASLDSFTLLSTLSTAGFVAGGVLAAAGVVLVITAPKAAPTGDAWVAPVIGPGYAGAQGRF